MRGLLLENRKALRMANGVVGNSGTNIPTTPRARLVHPKNR
jgi:hypothetical protein